MPAPAPGILGQAWALSGSVSLRAEPFGAMAYDFRTRRLSFLKSRTLVAVVERLADAPTLADALAWAGVEADEQPRYLQALEELAASGMIGPRDSGLDSARPTAAVERRRDDAPAARPTAAATA